MVIYLGLGSNEGDRKSNILQALSLLKSAVQIEKVSPLYENPALLPDDYHSSWNRPFLNMALKGETSLDIGGLFSFIQNIEIQLGRKTDHHKWSPRTIDIDILVGDKEWHNAVLDIPHPFLTQRDFVLSPLRDIEPDLKIHEQSILQLSRKLENKLPAWMDIFNLTPDSFSDGGDIFNEGSLSKLIKDKIKEKIKVNMDFSIQYLDVGGYSTRPDAVDVGVEEEWSRICPFFEMLKNINHLMKISVDTFRVEIAKRALKYGADIINDVSGLSDPQMIDLLKNSDCDYILMHSLSVPANKKIIFSEQQDPIKEIKIWLEQKLNTLEKNRIDLKRVIFDPGIGFGKTAQQSLNLLKSIDIFMEYPVRLMVGHSRKSFIADFSKVEGSAVRDFESIGISMELAKKGVDIIRVHNASKHARAWLAQKHVS